MEAGLDHGVASPPGAVHVSEPVEASPGAPCEVRRESTDYTDYTDGKMISLETIVEPDRFDAMRDEWSALLQRSSSDCVFLTHEWLSTWWQHLSEGRKLQVVVAREGARLVGIL